MVTVHDEDELETISAVQRQQDSRQSGKKECTRCGRKQAFRKCPAWGKTCLKCQGTNHFAHVSHKNGELSGAGKRMRTKGKCERCDSAPAGDQRERVQVTTGKKQQSDNTATTRKQGTQLEKTHEGPIYQLCTIKDAESNEDVWRVMFKVDTGAEASILPRTVYNRLLHRPQLLASKARIIRYGAKESIPVEGQCICQVTLVNGTTRHLRFLVVPFDEEPLLGLRATRHMDLISVAAVLIKSPSAKHDSVLGAGKFDDKVEMNSVVSSFREIFGGIGFLKSFLYTMHLKEEAQAYAVATPRRVPLPYYDKLESLGTPSVCVE